MKKIITLFIAVLFSMQLVSGQKAGASFSLSPQALHDFYIQKSKTKTITGFILLFAGIAMANEQIKINASRPQSEANRYNKNKKLWLYNFGKATTLASIPFFISSRRKKENARLTLK